MEPINKIIGAITSLLVTIVFFVAFALVGVRFLGYEIYAVLSGSMEPLYKTGSLIYVKDINYKSLKQDDVITFSTGRDIVVTHRIVGVVVDKEYPSEVRFQTKGDANKMVDGLLVHYKNVIGVPKFTIPKLGYIANYIQNPPGTYVSIVAGIMLLILVFLPDIIDDKE